MVTPGAEFRGVTLHNNRGQKVIFERQRHYLNAVDSGCYLASSITSHFKIPKLRSMSSTRLVSGA